MTLRRVSISSTCVALFTASTCTAYALGGVAATGGLVWLSPAGVAVPGGGAAVAPGAAGAPGVAAETAGGAGGGGAGGGGGERAASEVTRFLESRAPPAPSTPSSL